MRRPRNHPARHVKPAAAIAPCSSGAGGTTIGHRSTVEGSPLPVGIGTEDGSA
jgi:hypothetical protein